MDLRSGFAAGVVRARLKRTDRPALGSRFPRTGSLAKPDALFAARLAARTVDAILRLDSLSVFAIVVIVVNVPVFRRVFRDTRVVRPYLCHAHSLRWLASGKLALDYALYSVTESVLCLGRALGQGHAALENHTDRLQVLARLRWAFEAHDDYGLRTQPDGFSAGQSILMRNGTLPVGPERSVFTRTASSERKLMLMDAMSEFDASDRNCRIGKRLEAFH